MTNHYARPGTNVELILMSEPVMTALLDGDIAHASQRLGLPLPRAFLDYDWLWRYRVRQVREDPEAAPWLVRAVVAMPERVVVGHAGFHGPPDARGMVEIGYTILPEHRRRGYARAAVATLLDEAAVAPGVEVVRASISPDNAGSLAVIRPFGLAQVGEQWDEEDGSNWSSNAPLADADQASSRQGSTSGIARAQPVAMTASRCSISVARSVFGTASERMATERAPSGR